ncbi:hypothetical protein [Leptothrix cholodnii]|uniref:hypothetical protein n=1 Tax=Leptothrix cholodnii TaxID=34029 RepID=UPI0012371F31|nr:hypothetical protein [Leptothrix cholodnii]
MPSIISYRKVTDAYTTHALRLPDGATELATVDGITFVSLPDGATLPEGQPEQIEAQAAPLTAEQRDAIRAASPHVKLIGQRVVDHIRAMYSPDDEMYLARIGTGAALGVYELEAGEREELARYQAHVEACREWGRAQRVALGV